MNICVVSAMRNEGPFLLEWIAHMRAIGVTDFVIYSNDCDDGTDQMLASLDQQGILHHIPQTVDGGASPQWQALRSAWKQDAVKSADWVMVCDVDEFMNVHIGQGGLIELIAACSENVEAIAMPWRLFGHSGHTDFQDRPVTEVFTKSAPVDMEYPIAATFIKTLFRKDGRFNQLGVHRPKQKNSDNHGVPLWADGSGQELPSYFAANAKRMSLVGTQVGRNLVECNHYSIKSIESFLVKRERGLPNRRNKQIDLSYWVNRNFNQVENTSISRGHAAMTVELKALLSIPGLKAAHDAACRWHKAKAQKILQTPDGFDLFTNLLLTGDSKAMPRQKAFELYKMFQSLEQPTTAEVQHG